MPLHSHLLIRSVPQLQAHPPTRSAAEGENGCSVGSYAKSNERLEEASLRIALLREEGR